MTLDRTRRKVKKDMLLRGIQQHLAQLVDREFDGVYVGVIRKGYCGKLRATRRGVQDIFDPYEEVRERKLLVETDGQ